MISFFEVTILLFMLKKKQLMSNIVKFYNEHAIIKRKRFTIISMGVVKWKEMRELRF